MDCGVLDFCPFFFLLTSILEHDKEMLIKCRKWLGALEVMDTEYKKNQNLLLDGTCAWVLRTEEFQAWINVERKHLWVYGKPGAYLIEARG